MAWEPIGQPFLDNPFYSPLFMGLAENGYSPSGITFVKCKPRGFDLAVFFVLLSVIVPTVVSPLGYHRAVGFTSFPECFIALGSIPKSTLPCSPFRRA